MRAEHAPAAEASDGEGAAARSEIGALEIRHRALHRSSTEILDVAAARGIPFELLDTKRHTLIQLGHGVHQKRIRTTTTSRTPYLGTMTALDKSLANQLLGGVGIPVPRSIPVSDADAAVAAASSIGYPVVLKPRFGKSGIGVSTGLRSARDVRRAFARAKDETRDAECVIEQHVAGRDFRVLVIAGRTVAVTEWAPARVMGDGVHTVEELVGIANADPRRGSHKEKPLTWLPLGAAEEACLAAEGLTRHSVPEAGRPVWLAESYPALSECGTSIDRSDAIHPANRQIAEIAVETIGLDVAGVDIVAPDIGVPLSAGTGVVVEVNQSPGLRGHLYPIEGPARDVVGAYLDLLFPAGSDGRVPIVSVADATGSGSTVRLIAHLVAAAGMKPGTATKHGIEIAREMVSRADMSGAPAARVLLRNPRIDTAILEVAPERIAADGLGYDRNDVAVVIGSASPGAAASPGRSPARGTSAASVLVRAVPRSGTAVLDADDPDVLRLARACPGSIVLFTTDAHPDSPGARAVASHHDDGGAGLVLGPTVDGDSLVVLDGRGRRTPLAPVRRIPFLQHGPDRDALAAVLAAAATARALGVSEQDIERGLTSFDRSMAPPAT